MGFGHISSCPSPTCLWPQGLLLAAYPQFNPVRNGSSHGPQSGGSTGNLWTWPHVCSHTLQLLRGKCCSFISPCSRYQDDTDLFSKLASPRRFLSIFCVAFIWTHFSIISLLRSQKLRDSSSYHLHPAYHISPSSAWTVFNLSASISEKSSFWFSDQSWWTFGLMAAFCAQWWCCFLSFGFVRLFLHSCA